MEPLGRGDIDAVFDEGIKVWLDEALAAGLSPIQLEPTEFDAMERLGWRKVSLPKARFPRLARDVDTLDFSGWPIYANASLAEQVAYEICDALAAREAEIPWEKGTHADGRPAPPRRGDVGIASTGNRIDSRVEDSTPTDRINFAGGTSASRRSLPNRTYAEMAAHYGTAVLPTRPRWPRDKAKVEACVLIVERWLIGRLRDRRF